MKSLLAIITLVTPCIPLSAQDSPQSPAPITFQPVYIIPGYHGAYGCGYPVSGEAFEAAVKRILAEQTPSARLESAVGYVRGSCLLVSQSRQLLDMFAADEEKLRLAKECHSHQYDIDNFGKLYQAFNTAAAGSELESWVKSRSGVK